MHTPFTGLRVPGTLDVDAVTSYAPRLTYGQFFSHSTAARMHGLPVPSRIPDELHVTAIQPVRAPRIPGVIAHHIRPHRAAITLLDGVRVADPVAAWASLAPLLSINELVVVGDALVRRKNALATMEDLLRTTRRLRGGRGARKLAAALAAVRPRTDSVQESWLRIRVMAAGLPEPQVNTPVLARDGTFIGFADLCWPRHGVILEYDGEQHQTDEEQYLKDIERLEAFMAAGNRVIRANKSHGPWHRAPIARVRAALLRELPLSGGPGGAGRGDTPGKW